MKISDEIRILIRMDKSIEEIVELGYPRYLVYEIFDKEFAIQMNLAEEEDFLTDS
ncbi:MAG: hypothetical protein ACE5K0_00420 [Candidatus Methanofastidiosia archaeon]